MNLDQKYYKLRKTPLDILIKKLIEKQKSLKLNKSQRALDLTNSTYNNELVDVRSGLFHFDFNSLDESQLTIFREIANNAIEHKFKLLSDNFIKIAHQNTYSGFEGNNYSNQYEQFKYENGKESWLNSSFALGNRDYLKEISKLLPNDYHYIDWQVDFKSGYRWNELDWSKDIVYGNYEGADIKVPWELGRLQHLPILLIIGKIDKNARCIEEIENQFIDFYLSNPPRFGTQWMTSMDVSIRLVNLLFLLDIAKSNNLKFSDNFNQIVSKSLVSHYEFIWANLEFSSGFRANHYLINICALLIASVYIYEKYGSYIAELIELIEIELSHQFYSDGGNFENSTAYHKLVTEMIVITNSVLLNSMNFQSDKFSTQTENTISFIKQFLLNIVYKNGKIPQIGDNDSGIIFRPNYSDYLLNIRYIKQLTNDDSVDFVSFQDFGLSKYSKLNYEIFIKHSTKLGNNGKGGHDHNDALSFVLASKTGEIFVNQGTYCYTASKKQRNHYRSTKAHNVLYIENYEQNEFYGNNKDDLFWIAKQNAVPNVISVNHLSFIGEIAYAKSTYRRTFFIKDDSLIVKESVANDLEKELHFHLNCGIYIKYINENAVFIITENEKIRFTFDNGNLEIEEYWLSPDYGVKLKAYKMIIKFKEKELNWYLDFSENNEY